MEDVVCEKLGDKKNDRNILEGLMLVDLCEKPGNSLKIEQVGKNLRQ